MHTIYLVLTRECLQKTLILSYLDYEFFIYEANSEQYQFTTNLQIQKEINNVQIILILRLKKAKHIKPYDQCADYSGLANRIAMVQVYERSVRRIDCGSKN